MNHNSWVLSRFVHILVIHFGCIAATIKNQNWGFRDQVFFLLSITVMKIKKFCSKMNQILFFDRMIRLIFDDHAVVKKCLFRKNQETVFAISGTS